MKIKPVFILISIIFLITGCTSGAPQENAETQSPTIVFPTPVKTKTPDPNLPSGPITLKIWLPPEFDPNNGSVEGDLFKKRLDDFTARRPGVQVEVRVKDLDGPSSLLESLSATKEAAPLALPDLVALPGDQMQIAASQNLIYPLANFISNLENEDWYDFALDLGKYQGEQYGIPFAVHALVMAYHPIIVGEPPVTWEEILQSDDILAFPAADPDVYFTLALYQSLGGEILGENGNVQLDRGLLERVFDFYQQANTAGVMPDWLVEITSDELTWSGFMKNQSQMAITWTTHFSDPSTGGINFAAIPTQDGTPFTYCSGWVWGLSGYDSSHYRTAVDLAEFLTEGESLGEWTLALGYLPPRPSSVVVWSSDPELAFVSQILPNAIVIPDISEYPGLGEALVQATIKVLKQDITPGEAVDEVLASITN
jgi:ABC-type glycerol-3-phosphate transport system substrate-binding protein